ncbi:hypothetical protein ISN45_Aa05g012690 [Arabidopsis thaliana x Arabidopsis arenosa]|uniref:Transmembrane protein n=1 Tax=Arabidopsis thaliana x Arabidopsis arenosa TaxID=1240361 RepID=A0A8T1ZN49_9BRAS|nr:hypothetical protein ISN45_Aa05g012690 [Arabidopsis thaliana x Arabidopsis arenosa]
MKKTGLTCRWIASDAVFNKFSIKFNVLVVATLILLRMTWREFIDFENFEISKVTSREAMGLLTLMMACFYYSGSFRWILSDLLEFNDPLVRIDKELAMLYGFLTLAFYLMNLFGFFWGLLWLPVSPPSLLLVLRFAKSRNVKEFQD